VGLLVLGGGGGGVFWGLVGGVVWVAGGGGYPSGWMESFGLITKKSTARCLFSRLS